MDFYLERHESSSLQVKSSSAQITSCRPPWFVKMLVQTQTNHILAQILWPNTWTCYQLQAMRNAHKQKLQVATKPAARAGSDTSTLEQTCHRHLSFWSLHMLESGRLLLLAPSYQNAKQNDSYACGNLHASHFIFQNMDGHTPWSLIMGHAILQHN